MVAVAGAAEAAAVVAEREEDDEVGALEADGVAVTDTD